MLSVILYCYKDYMMIRYTFRKKIYILLLFLMFSPAFPADAASGEMFYYFDNVLSKLSTSINDATADILPLNFKTLSGNWDLFYGNDYGYSFRFTKNYRAIIIVYLNTNSVVFKGVYNIENSNAIRINISEMKRVESVKELDLKGGFVKAKSSYFIFNARAISREGKKNLELRPRESSIDGKDSEGYFEPYIKLEYSGK